LPKLSQKYRYKPSVVVALRFDARMSLAFRLMGSESMKSMIRAVAAVVVATIVAGCSSVSAKHDFNRAVDFDDYKTFSWISAHPLVAAPAGTNPLLEGRIQQTARELLMAKGYRFVEDPEQADFVVGFAVGATDKVRIDSYPASYRGAWHWPGVYAQDVNVRQFIEGRLTVDIFDVATHQPAWHGWATKNVTPKDQSDSRPAIREALTAILANFPPG
jgi:Domain of unknown function (DUF4136)